MNKGKSSAIISSNSKTSICGDSIFTMTQHNFLITPGGCLTGTVNIPGDKSISHRSIMLGAIANGRTDVYGFLAGEDCLATIQAFRAMGVTIEGPDNGTVIIEGVGKHGLHAAKHLLDLGNSGTSMRLLTGLLAGQPFVSQLSGDESLQKRPMGRVVDPLTAMGAQIDSHEGKPPLFIHATKTMHGITYQMPIASAQVKSALLLAGLYATGTTTVIEPSASRDHTERMLQSFAYPIEIDDQRISIDGNAELKATRIDVPADISSAAFFIVAATITPGSSIMLKNIGINPTRIGVITILRMMGAAITLHNQRLFGAEPVADIQVNYAPLHGIEIPVEQVPQAIDEFPILFIAAACAQGQTVLRGAKELRVKESDRIQTMADGLQILGIDAQPLDDGIVINGGIMRGGEIDSHGDHRIAMAFAIAGLLSQQAIKIKDCSNVATSFPEFVAVAQKAGLSIILKALEF